MIDGIKQVGVVGAGAMGAGVAQSFAVAGYPVRLQDIAEAALTRGKGAIKKSLEPKARDAALQRIAPTTRIDDFADCDVVVEAVLERFDVKKAVTENLDGVCRPETILATNTSSISVTRIARSPLKMPGMSAAEGKPSAYRSIAAVWRAMRRSSSVGMTQTATDELSALISPSRVCPFRAGSRMAPIQREPSTISARVKASRSPIPAENTSPSMPPKAATSEPNSRTIR